MEPITHSRSREFQCWQNMQQRTGKDMRTLGNGRRDIQKITAFGRTQTVSQWARDSS